jgi:DNA-binding transcriptional MerR regulator
MLSTLRAARALRRKGMPLEEIHAVLTTDDPAVVRRLLGCTRNGSRS